MDEILLTPEEQENAANRGPDDDWTNICRAQVRKVVEWINDNVDGHAGGYWNYGDRVLHEDKWQALREAAGEGK